MPLRDPNKSERDKRATRLVLRGVVLTLLALLFWAKVYFSGISTPQGWSELLTLRKDPMASFDPPHTKLRQRNYDAAGTRDLFGSSKETRIFKLYEMRGKPSRTLEVVANAAREAGWRFIEAECDVADKTIRLSFDKPIKDDFTALMSATIALPDGLDEEDYRNVTISLYRPRIELDLVSKPQTRTSISCLDGLT